MDIVLTVYQLNDISEVKGLKEAIAEFDKINKVKIENEHIPAASDFFGNAMSFILSEPIETIITIYTLGQIIQKIITITKKSGKKMKLGKGLIKSLALSKLKDLDSVAGRIENLEEPVIWGPMLIDNFGGKFENIIDTIEYDAAVGAYSYLIAIALKKDPDRVRTIWQIIGEDGTILLSWSTQTYENRVPEFLRPN